jgi:hypothetical protein
MMSGYKPAAADHLYAERRWENENQYRKDDQNYSWRDTYTVFECMWSRTFADRQSCRCCRYVSGSRFHHDRANGHTLAAYGNT